MKGLIHMVMDAGVDVVATATEHDVWYLLGLLFLMK